MYCFDGISVTAPETENTAVAAQSSTKTDNNNDETSNEVVDGKTPPENEAAVEDLNESSKKSGKEAEGDVASVKEVGNKDVAVLKDVCIVLVLPCIRSLSANIYINILLYYSSI